MARLKQAAQREADAQAAAYLSGERKLKQREIAALLGDVSQSHVSRLLRLAEDRGWLETTYNFLIFEKLPPDRQEALRRLVEPKALIDALHAVTSATGVRVREVRVFDSGGVGKSPRALETRLRRFGRAAAPRVKELIQGSAVCAVTWGTTVAHIVGAIEASLPLEVSPPPKGPPIRFVPVCAEPLEQSSNKDTSSHLVSSLHRILQGGALPPLSLTGVAALIPRRFTGRRAAAIRDFVQSAASYRDIFGPRAPVIDTVDTLLSSIGPARRAMGFIHEELLLAGSTPKKRLTSRRLAALVAGDLGGVLLERPGLDAEARAEVAALNAMWTGIKLAHIERIAREADRARHPGVIVVTLGRDRVEVVAAAVRRGLINELIVDRELADELPRALAQALG